MAPPKLDLNVVFHDSLDERLNASARGREHKAYLELAEFIRGRVNAWIAWAAKNAAALDPAQFDQLWRDISDQEAFYQIPRRDREVALKALFDSIRRQLFLGRIEISPIPPVAPEKEVFIEPPFPPPEIEGDSDVVMIREDDDAVVIMGRARRIPCATIQAVFVHEPGEPDPKKWKRVKGHRPDSNVFGHHAPRRNRDYDLEFPVLYHTVDGGYHLSPSTGISVVHEAQEETPEAVMIEEPRVEDSPPPPVDPRAVVDDDLKGRWFREE